MHAFDYREPDTLEEALALLHSRGDDAKVIAGGTALVIMLKQRLVMLACLVSLRRISDVGGVDLVDGTLRLGALATHRAVETAPLVRARIPVLADTYRQVATIRVRNMATVGGSLAHADPNQDPPPMLMALDARARLVSAGGRREVPLDEFFTDYYETVLKPDELVSDVLIPIPKPNAGSIYLKFLPRTADDYATVGVAATVQIDPSSGLCQDCRIAMSCVGPTPLRAKEAEDLLRGQKLMPELLREAAALAERVTDPVSDARGSADYKRAMAGVFVRRALEQAWHKALR